VLKDIPADAVPDEPEGALYPRLLWTGIALTVLYVVLIEKLGFFLCTVIYLAAFMWIGRYRRIGVIVATSVIGAAAFMFMFMKVVYVSLPLGVEPFAQVSFRADAHHGHPIAARQCSRSCSISPAASSPYSSRST
jgi:putative tricarboxylic transport membrane protein